MQAAAGIDRTRTGARDFVQAFRRSGFRWLWASRMLTQFADGLFQASLVGAVFFNPERQATAQGVATGFAVLLLPYSLVGPFAGPPLDRWRRQRVLVWVNLPRAAMAGLVAAWLIGAGPSGPVYFGAALVVLSLSRLYYAAAGAALPHLVEPQLLPAANSALTGTGALVAALGAGFIFVFRFALGAGTRADAAAGLGSALVYLAAAAAANVLAADSLGPDDPQRVPLRTLLSRVVHDLRLGARAAWGSGATRAALAAITAHRMCYGAITIVTILLYRNHFHTHGLLHAGLAGLGQLVSAGALGLLAGALLTPLAARRLRLRTWAALALGAIGLAILAFVLPLSLAPMLAGGFVIGFGGQATKITVDTIVQEAIVDAFRARVFALYDALYNASYVAAAALAAVVLPKSGVAPGLVAGLGAGYLAVALLYGLSGRRGSTPGPAGTPADSVLPARLGGAAPPG